MKKGLTLTLLTVVVAWVGFQAQALAPVISDMPDFIVGNGDEVTGAMGFVYPDAIHLDDYVVDPDGSDANVLWSFDSAGRYLLNGVEALSSGDPLAPGAKEISSAANIPAGEADFDTNAHTVTLRDQIFTPLTGTGTTPGSNGIVASEVVTLYASDGSTYAQTSILVYSNNGGQDSTSPVAPLKETMTFGVGQTHGFAGTNEGGTTSVTADGLCMTVDLTGMNFATWASAYGSAAEGLDLVDNKIYKFHLYATSDQTTPLKVPLWDFIVENLDPGVAGDFAYAADIWVHDNVGSANATKGPSVGRNDFYFWYAPAAVATPQWKDASTGAFTAAHDPNNDMRYRWRTLDSDLPYGGANDSGTVCLQSVTVQRFDLNDMFAVGAPVYEVTNFGTADVLTFDVVTGSGAQESTFTVGGGGELTITPQNASVGWDLQICSINPGDGVWNPTADTGLPDDFPIAWEGETLYQIVSSISAEGSAGGLGETNGHDAIRISMDNPGFELISESYMTTGLDRCGAPKAGAGQDFMAFYYSNSESLSSVANHHRLRPRLDALSTTGYNRPDGVTNNKGGMVFHNWKVQKVTFPGMAE